MIVGEGGAAVPIQLGDPLRSWVLEPDLDKYRAIDPHVFVNTAMDTVAGGVPDDIRADYLASYEGDRFVESMRYVRAYPEQLPAACGAPAATSRRRSRSSTADTTASCRSRTPSSSTNGCPNSRLRLIDAGHFVWEEAPAEYASIILDSISGSGS